MLAFSLVGCFVVPRLPRDLGPRLLRHLSATKPLTELEGTRALTRLSEHEIALKHTVRRFMESEVKPLVREMDAKSKTDPRVIKGLFENGFMGVEVPTEFGGAGSTFFDVILIVEESARVEAAISNLLDVQNTFAASLLMQHGSVDLKQKYLPRITSDWVGAFAISEPDAGSDAFSLKTRARPDGDDFIIDGNKQWITNAGEASFFLVFANADPSKGYRGITCFLVDRDQKGVTVGKTEDMLGHRVGSTCPINFDGVRVHKSAILGELGKGET